MSIKILVLDDETPIRGFIKIKLKSLGYEVIDVSTGKEALQKINDTISIALLDIMLPDIDGIDVCKRMRMEYPKLGIIMLTAKGQEMDRVMGLTSGADDYVIKPFSPMELGARIESLLRRINVIPSNNDLMPENQILCPPFLLDIDKKSLKKDGKSISLTPTEYSIMLFFMKNYGKPISRNELLDKIWGVDYIGDIKTVDVNIRRIRQKIEVDPSTPEFIKTSWGFGYTWSANNE